MAMMQKDWTISALSVEFGMDRRTLAKRMNDVTPVRKDKKTSYYKMEDAARAIFAGASMPDVISWDEARARKVAAEAEMAEMELAKERGLLLPVEMVAEINENIFGVFRARMTALPAKAAPDVFSADSLTEAKTLLKQHINAALDELANSVVETYEPDTNTKQASS
jgi:phage terminase Nu1 subunit (DNA packaging protein)